MYACNVLMCVCTYVCVCVCVCQRHKCCHKPCFLYLCIRTMLLLVGVVKCLLFDLFSCHRSMKMNILRGQMWYSGMDTQRGRQVCMILPVNTGSVYVALQPHRKLLRLRSLWRIRLKLFKKLKDSCKSCLL